MSNKLTKRGCSHYIEIWNLSAKRYINTCVLCGHKGCSPAIEKEDFCSNFTRMVIYKELSRTLCKMPLDQWGRCEDCARIQDSMRTIREK